jgi:calcineurin-like phosphoesterase family protein
MYTWPNSNHGSWNIHGHSHGSLDKAPWGKSVDAGINIRDYYPLSFLDIRGIMQLRNILITDHRRLN